MRSLLGLFNVFVAMALAWNLWEGTSAAEISGKPARPRDGALPRDPGPLKNTS